jgi:FtsP/CotA-like multicopper oxidase with cupredoxin domain
LCSRIGFFTNVIGAPDDMPDFVSRPLRSDDSAFNCTAGILKDTIVVQPMMGSVSIDVQTDNPGAFLFHCHNDIHMSAGLATVMRYV